MIGFLIIAAAFAGLAAIIFIDVPERIWQPWRLYIVVGAGVYFAACLAAFIGWLVI